METYLVGGAVRDELLGLAVKERDWVVVGATPETLLDAGYRQVGRDFPVFLHPRTREEYALARTERKAGHGYRGFAVDCAPQISLEEDLLRRDLTVNAMARGADGTLIDPHGGRADLDARVLRHVSPAFVEDPLRVLRTARFAARYAALGFRIADETMDLMREISRSGELDHLAVERVWVETERALTEARPDVYVEALRDCAALEALMPEVDALFGIPQRVEYHPEIDTGTHLLMVLQQAARLRRDSRLAFAALTHDLGKGITAADSLPSHRGHELAGLPLVEALCRRLRVPQAHRQLALCVCEYHLLVHRALELRGSTLLQLLEASGALRDEERFELFLQACEADSRGRLGLEARPYPQGDYLRQARVIALGITAARFAGTGVSGRALGEAIRAERVEALETLRGNAAQRG